MRIVKICLLFMVVLAAFPASACELPAHPSAAAIPKKNTDGMFLVEEGTSFYYLVKEGTSAQMKIVWDPAMHNRPSGLNKDEYDGIVKENIAGDTEVDKINGAGFFALSEMSNFFQVKGNRGDVKEAFERESGADLDQDYVSDLSLGPSSALGTFAKADQEQEFSVVGGSATDYGNAPYCEPKSVSEKDAGEADAALPSRKWLSDKETITLENGTTVEKKFYTLPTNDKVEIHDCGIYMKDLVLKISEIEPEKYKAFIYGSNKATEVLTEGITYDPDSTNAVGPEFTMTFTTPTINSTKEDSLIKIKVESPPAGFDFSNIFWVWQEDLYKYTEKTVSEPVKNPDGTPKLDDDGDPVTVEVTKAFYELVETGRKCSTGLHLLVYKPAASQGFSAFRVYDTESPIASEFNVGTPVFNATGPTKVDFTMKMVDSNPFAHVDVNEVASGTEVKVDLTQNLSKLGLEVFYNYPTYKYKGVTANSFAELDGKGLADLADAAGTSPRFKTYTHETQWFWKKATVDVTSITQLDTIEKTTDKCGDKIVGAVYEIKGSFTIPNPKPWHEYSPDPKRFALFAMCKDSRGNPCKLYDSVVNFVETNKNTPLAAAKLAEKPEWAFDPSSSNTLLPANDEPANAGVLADKCGFDADNWQKMQFISSSDDIGPEIEVIVCDTRTNRYHIFGTAKDVAGDLNKLTDQYLTDYATLASPPYLAREKEISDSYKFADFSGLSSLFDMYLQGPDAVSQIKTPGVKGFVCQKNSRLVFYARAFDNQGYMDSDRGISTFNMELVDKHESKTEDTMLTPLEHVFRYENVDESDNVAPYVLTVTATDKHNNSRQFNLNIAVLGRTLEIRTLEERRERMN